MSSTGMLTTNELTLKKWAKEGWYNLGQKTIFGHMMDRGAIFFAEELMGQRAKGDELTYDYTNKLTGIPVGEGGTLDGNEEALDLGFFKLAMNVTRVGVLNPNEDTIEQQRTNVAFEKRARQLIPARHAELIDTSVLYQLAGANPTSFTLNGTTWSGTNKLFVQGHNTPVAPSTNRIIRAAAAANDQSLTSSDKMSLQLIDYMLEKNNRSDQPIQTFDDGTFDFYVSPEQVVDLRLDTTNAVQWWQKELAMISGGFKNNTEGSFRNGSIMVQGKYRNVNIIEAPRAAYGVNGSTSAVITTVRRAVLTGKDALAFASPFGGRITDTDVPLRFKTQEKDYGYYKGIEGRFLGGLKKNVASNSEDIGVMVLSTYAASHA